MGLFDSLFGSSSGSTSANTGTSEAAQTGTQNTNQTGNTTQNTNQTNNTSSQSASTTTENQATTGSQVVSTLDPATQALITSLLPHLTANAAAGTGGADSGVNADQTIAANLFTKATTGDQANQDALTAANVKAAQLQYETGEGQQVAGIAQSIGSADNSYSKLIANKGQNDLATQLAQIKSQGNIAASNQETSDYQAAVQAISGGASVGATDVNTAITPLLDFIAALKGANTSSTSSTDVSGVSGTSSSTNTLEQILAAIQGTSVQNTDESSSGDAAQTNSSNSTGSGSATPGLLQSIFSL